MSKSNEHVEEPQANPYNAKKDWHTPDEPSKGSADGMFFEERQATPKAKSQAAPEKQESSTTDYKKRYDDLKKHYDQKVSSFKQRELELQAEAAEEYRADYVPPKSNEELNNFREEYPDLYDTVETVAHLQSEQNMEAVRAKMGAIEVREAEINRREAETTLRDHHPDFEEIRGDEQFHEWAKEQPEEIQDWIYDNPDDVSLASKAIDLYKMESGISTGSRSRKGRQSQSSSSAADMVSTKTTNVDTSEPRIWTQREIASLSMDQYDKFEQEIDLAVSEGRVRP